MTTVLRRRPIFHVGPHLHILSPYLDGPVLRLTAPTWIDPVLAFVVIVQISDSINEKKSPFKSLKTISLDTNVQYYNY